MLSESNSAFYLSLLQIFVYIMLSLIQDYFVDDSHFIASEKKTLGAISDHITMLWKRQRQHRCSLLLYYTMPPPPKRISNVFFPYFDKERYFLCLIEILASFTGCYTFSYYYKSNIVLTDRQWGSDLMTTMPIYTAVEFYSGTFLWWSSRNFIYYYKSQLLKSSIEKLTASSTDLLKSLTLLC